jgi:DNA-binding IclR family transcriptional regulator
LASTSKATDVAGGKRRMMVALAQRPGLSARQLGIRAGLSSSSGTFSTYLGALRAAGWLDGTRDSMALTSDGLAALGNYTPLPTGPGLFNYWKAELGSSGASRMLQALYDAHPEMLTKARLAERAGISPASGTFSTYLGKLRSLELVQDAGGGCLIASDEFFQ